MFSVCSHLRGSLSQLSPGGWVSQPTQSGGRGSARGGGGQPGGGGQSGGSARGGQPRYNNRMSTHYMAGGMPLAFTQEDFLVTIGLYDKQFCQIWRI